MKDDLVVLKTNKEKWSKVSQEGEFDYHLKNEWRQSADFMAQTEKLFTYFNLGAEDYAGKTVIDLGAGSKLRTKYFKGADIIAIEPLADKFMASIEWSDLKDAIEVYSVPAEQRVEQCVDRADLLVSINVIDHCYDFEDVIKNIYAYVKPGGYAFLSFDKHEQADDMHPLSLTEEICEKIFSDVGFKIDYFTRGFGGVINEDTYGHGPYALNYGLIK